MKPANEFIDQNGIRQVEFVCSYEFDGKQWGTSVWASTWEEAEMKLRAMSTGKVDGILKGTIPADDDTEPD